jgi:hypothetical protein
MIFERGGVDAETVPTQIVEAASLNTRLALSPPRSLGVTYAR